MGRSDWFAVLVAIFVLGAGAYLSTFPTETIRGAGLSLMVGAIGGLAIWFSIEYGSRKLNFWGAWALIVGGPVIGLLWLYFGGKPLNAAAKAEIAIGCHSALLPKNFGPNEIVRALNLFPTPVENGGGGLAIFSNYGGKEWQWKIDNGPASYATRCEITNYGSFPVFDFKMLLDLTFIEAVDVPEQENAKKQGPVKLRRKWVVDAQKIDPGPANSFAFWIYNLNRDLFVNVLLPHSATVTKLGDNKQIEVNLTVPQVGGEIPLFFGPKFNTDSSSNDQK